MVDVRMVGHSCYSCLTNVDLVAGATLGLMATSRLTLPVCAPQSSPVNARPYTVLFFLDNSMVKHDIIFKKYSFNLSLKSNVGTLIFEKNIVLEFTFLRIKYFLKLDTQCS